MDADAFEFAQMTLFSVALAVTMFVFGAMEHGTSTKILCFTLGGLFVVVTLLFGRATAKLAASGRAAAASAGASSGAPAGAARR